MQDLSGPKIRTGRSRAAEVITADAGQTLRIAAGDQAGSAGAHLHAYEPLVESAKPGDRLLLDDGRIELRVEERRADELVTVVVNGGRSGSTKASMRPASRCRRRRSPRRTPRICGSASRSASISSR